MSGWMYSVSAVASPVVALFYLDVSDHVIKASRRLCFIVTNTLSLIYLVVVGKVHLEQNLLPAENPSWPGRIFPFF